MLRSLPLTRLGGAVLAIAGLSLAAGLIFRWREFIVIASGCLLLLVMSSVFAFGHLSLELERTVEPSDISVGTLAVTRLVFSNPTDRRRRSITVHDQIDGRTYVETVPSLGPGESHTMEFELPTHRRTVFPIGPIQIVRADPLNLFNRSRQLADAESVHVWPRRQLLDINALGPARDLDGPTSDGSPAGSESFHTIREYELGDDYRLVHWRSTAKNGFQTLLVRHFVDNRRPELVVALDTTTPYSDSGFEIAVELAASLIETSNRAGIPTSLVVGANNTRHGLSQHNLNLLASLNPDEAAEEDQLRRLATSLRRTARPTATVIAIVGDVTTEIPVSRFANIGGGSLDVVRITTAERPPAQLDLRTRVIDLDHNRAFGEQWRTPVSS